LSHCPRNGAGVRSQSITAIEVERFRNAELEAGKTPGTANFAVQVLPAVFNTARRRGLCPANPAEAVEMLAVVSEEHLSFSKDQVKDLLRVADNQWQGMILLGYHTGIRLSDAANLTWANVDLLNRTLVFRARKTAGRNKNRAEKFSRLHAPRSRDLFRVTPRLR
jgi:integrase